VIKSKNVEDDWSIESISKAPYHLHETSVITTYHTSKWSSSKLFEWNDRKDNGLQRVENIEALDQPAVIGTFESEKQ